MFDNVTHHEILKPCLAKEDVEIVLDVVPPPVSSSILDGVDGRGAKRNILSRLWPNKSASLDKRDDSFASKKTAAEGMMDIALLTANANQLRFLFVYNSESQTYITSVSLIILSLVLQVAVGVTLIFKVSDSSV